MAQVIESWFVGSFTAVQAGRYEFLWIIVLVTFFIFIYANRLTLAGLGEDVSKSLGVNYNTLFLLQTADRRRRRSRCRSHWTFTVSWLNCSESRLHV